MAKKGEINPERFSPKNQPVVIALLRLRERLGQNTPPPQKEAIKGGGQQLLGGAGRLKTESQR